MSDQDKSWAYSDVLIDLDEASAVYGDQVMKSVEAKFQGARVQHIAVEHIRTETIDGLTQVVGSFTRLGIREPKSPHFGGGFLVPKLLSPHLFSIHLILESCWLQTDHQTVVGNHQAADQPQMCLMFD